MLNLTQHKATQDQIDAGVTDAPEEYSADIKRLLTFDSLPDRFEVQERAEQIAQLASVWGADEDCPDPGLSAMIGGAPFLMSALESALLDYSIKPFYAFSQRESKETTDENGNVTKTNVFRHVGFVS
jgi:hypothetical protein